MVSPEIATTWNSSFAPARAAGSSNNVPPAGLPRRLTDRAYVVDSPSGDVTTTSITVRPTFSWTGGDVVPAATGPPPTVIVLRLVSGTAVTPISCRYRPTSAE